MPALRPPSTLPPPPDDEEPPTFVSVSPERPPARPARPQTTPQEAAHYDGVVVPRWCSLFGRSLVARVPQGARVQVLDAGCGTGHPAFEVLRKLGDGGRVIAIDRDPVLVDLARRRALGDAGKRIFFKVEPLEHLSFGDEVFDFVVGNLALESVDDEGAALAEMRRVLAPDGRVILTRSLAGTFEEVLDMFREIAVRRDLTALGKRIEQVAMRHPSASAWRAQLLAAGFEDVEVHCEELRLPFRNARELFSDPMLRVVALPEWRWACGMDPGDEAILEQAERSLDVYFAGGPLSLTVQCGVAEARRPPG